MKKEENGGFLNNQTNQEMFIDIGVYGTSRLKTFETVSTHQKIEKFVIEIGGFQALYADSYLNETDFRKMFDHTLYEKIRKQYGCDKMFPSTYFKLCKNSRFE
jgi:hypothetical protein